jgi:apolipoprotein N-acyltransferase
MQWVRLAVGFGGLAAGYELGSLLTPIVGRIGFWVVTFATMFAVAGIADQIAKRVFRRRL